MRLHYVSFFYINFLLFIFLILRLDLFFLIILFLRKSHSVYKECLIEFFFQEIDGLALEAQFIDLYENKLYAEFDLDEGIEYIYTYNIFLDYALCNVNFDFEAFNGTFAFKWNDNNMEELNYNKDRKLNFKKVYITLNNNDYYSKNMVNREFNLSIDDADYYNIYNYKNIVKSEIEEPLFIFENEKFYYTYLKLFFLKENFYDTYIDDNYMRFSNYTNFLNNLKKRVLFNKSNVIKTKKGGFNVLFNTDFNENLLQIKKEYLDNNFFKKQNEE